MQTNSPTLIIHFFFFLSSKHDDDFITHSRTLILFTRSSNENNILKGLRVLMHEMNHFNKEPSISSLLHSFRSHRIPLRYHKPTLGVPLRYFIMIFMEERWYYFGKDLYRAYRYTLNIILGLIVVK